MNKDHLANLAIVTLGLLGLELLCGVIILIVQWAIKRRARRAGK